MIHRRCGVQVLSMHQGPVSSIIKDNNDTEIRKDDTPTTAIRLLQPVVAIFPYQRILYPLPTLSPAEWLVSWLWVPLAVQTSPTVGM